MDVKKPKITLFDLLLPPAKHWKLITILTVSVTVTVLLLNIISMVLPPTSPFNLLPDVYRPEVTVLLNSSSATGGLSSLVPSSVSSMLGSLGQPSNPNLTLVQELIKSNRILDTIGEEFGFRNKYKDAPLTQNRRKLMLAVKLAAEEGGATGGGAVIVRISYQNVDKELAARVLKRIIELVESEFKRITLERVSTKRQFLEEREKAVRGDFEKAKQALADFQKHYGLDLRSQAVNQAQAIAQLQADIYQDEFKIKASYLGEEDAYVRQLRDQIKEKKKLIAEIKSGAGSYSSSPVVPLDSVPGLMSYYANLEIEVRIQNEIYGLIRKELEMAKTEEASNAGVFQVINSLEVPELKSDPRRGDIMVITAVSSLLAGLLIAFLIEFMKSKKADPVEGRKLEAVRAQLPFLRFFRKKRP